MKKSLFTFLVLLSIGVRAQQTWYAYWFEFKDKDTSCYSLSRPQAFLTDKAIDRRQKYKVPLQVNDIPVCDKYITEVESFGYRVIARSRWMNALTVLSAQKLTADSIKRIKAVKAFSYLGEKRTRAQGDIDKKIDISEVVSELESKFNRKGIDTSFYGKAQGQLALANISPLHARGYWGNGIDIAVLDAGFKNADQLSLFFNLMDSARILGWYDLVDDDGNVFEDDDHGVAVLSCMAADKPYELVGSGPKANYWLIRSENAATEFPIEEAYWLEAAELADSLGADIISSSVGYHEFDDKTLNHKKKELNGRTAIISRAASFAASKGILVVNSAGNEGDDEWKQLGFPADVESVITIGSVNGKKQYSAFSSIGPSADKRVKPDVVAMGEDVYVSSATGAIYQGNGTSYACPIIAGACACLLQANRESSPLQVADALRMCADRYNDPDKFYGYGIPDLELADKILGFTSPTNMVKEMTVIDSRWLADDQLHITLFAPAADKVTVEVTDESGKLVFDDKFKIKEPGVKRFHIQKSGRLDKGVYKIKLLSGSQSLLFKTIKH